MDRWTWLLGVMVALLVSAPAFCDAPFVVGPFSSGANGGAFPDGWEPLVFKKVTTHTQYTLEDEDGSVVVNAVTDGGASGMIRRVGIDPEQWPVISWRWKVGNVYAKGDATTKKGDDYPARIYVAFAFEPDNASFTERLTFKAARAIHGEYPPVAVLNYIWANKTPKGTLLPNAYTGRAMMIAVQSGPDKAGTWITETRNILTDYKQAFGTTPPPISGVAIMTDADNTGESATAWYGDIQFLHAE
ncbi:hypothetical protein DSLASN_29990 [Desulfoluna limicola]|uniref:DUF3047 domain-containing protein n=1 Tax=Desulfoluna limicola TaxID=2810562 RepID=A0ABM7PJL3_9BACT|nr:DUF3047 domain-containing protein [Desulfoluna limicola]BCS97367.1 hypothetical protein DSLASN_29990 [Desulfoluna limicola]